MPLLKTHKGSVRLGAGHSLIIGHGPKLSTLTWNEDKAKDMIAKFGLFNLATPDTSTYYKDVSPEDLNPKPEDYFKPIFRGLSEVIVRKNYDPIDFTQSGVLKASMPLIVGQTVYTNHEAFVGNEKGVVSQSFWDNGYSSDNTKVPAGMNLEFMIHGKLHPKLVLDLQSDPPTVHSNSVTVNFNWQQSHPKMDFDTFRSKVGTHDDKGQLVRRIVTEILAYHETSLVSHGADPYAQIVGADGKIVNPKYAATRDSFSEAKHHTTFFGFDYKDSFSENTIPNSSNITEEEENLDNIKTHKMPKELILLLATLAGISLSAEQTGLSDEEFATKFDFEAFTAQLKTNKATLENLKSLSEVKTELEGQLETLKTEKIELAKFKSDNESKLSEIAQAEQFKGEVLNEVKRLSKLVNPESATKLDSTYDGSNIQTLQAFKTTLQAQVEEKFPASCKKCGSKEINRASSSANSEEVDPKMTYQQVIKDAKSPNADLSYLYPKD